VIHRKLNISNKKSQVKQEKLILVREGFLYGLKVEKYKSETSSLNRGITSTPSFVFYSSNTKVLIDFTNQTNSDLEKPIFDFFNQIQSGTNITITNGIYNDPNLNVTANVSGVYRFRGYFNGIVEADVISGTILSNKINRYDKTRFEQIPYIVATTFKSTTDKTVIKNRFGKNTKNSFNYLGVKVGDYIKITDMDKSAKILEIDVDTDGNEYIVIDRDISAIDLTNIKTTVLVYVSVVDA
jgi:hypothetical protein